MTRAVSRVLATPASSRINTACNRSRGRRHRGRAPGHIVHACPMRACSVSSPPRGGRRRREHGSRRQCRPGAERGERSARPRQRLDRLHRVLVRRQAMNDTCLLGRGARGEREHASTRARSTCRRLRRDAPARHARSMLREPPDRSSWTPSSRCTHRRARGTRRGALDASPVPPAPARPPRHHRLALGERVLLVGPPARSSQLAADAPRVGIRCLAGPSTSAASSRGPSPCGRPDPHDVTPRRGLVPVTLAPGCRARSLTAASQPGRRPPELRRAPRSAETVEIYRKLRAIALRSPPSRYARAQRTTERRYERARALVETRPPWRAGRSGDIKRRPPTVGSAPCSPPPHAYAVADSARLIRWR